MLISIEPGFEVEPGHRFLAGFTGFPQIRVLNRTGLGFFNESRSDRFDWPVRSGFQNLAYEPLVFLSALYIIVFDTYVLFCIKRLERQKLKHDYWGFLWGFLAEYKNSSFNF